MSSSSRGKWSVVGGIVSAPFRGYYYPGRVKAIKKSLDNSPHLYSVAFFDPLGSFDESKEPSMIMDFPANQLIGRGFEPIQRTLLSENQKVFITYRQREVAASVVEHDTHHDTVTLRIEIADHHHHLQQQQHQKSSLMTVRLNDVRLLPSRKSGRIQEPPDYSLLANSGRRSPDEENHITTANFVVVTQNGGNNNNNNNTAINANIQNNNSNNNNNNAKYKSGRRRTASTSSSSQSQSLLASSESLTSTSSSSLGPQVSAHIDVPTQSIGQKRRPSPTGSSDQVMDECTAALVLMSLSASPRSPVSFNERSSNYLKSNNRKIYKCTWPGCQNKTFDCAEIERHVRQQHLQTQLDDEVMSGDEDFYYTEDDITDEEKIELWHKMIQINEFSASSKGANLMKNVANGHTSVTPMSHAAATTTTNTHSSFGFDTPDSFSEDAASSTSSGMTNGDNSMDSSPPPSPINHHSNHHHHHRHHHGFFKPNSVFQPIHQHYPHLEDHEYFSTRRATATDPAGVSILNASSGRRSRGKNNPNNSSSSTSSLLSSSSSALSNPINIPNIDGRSSFSSFGAFSAASGSLSSGIGSYSSSFCSTFSPVSPARSSTNGSLSSQHNSTTTHPLTAMNSNSKYLRVNTGRYVTSSSSSGTTLLQQQQQQQQQSSLTTNTTTTIGMNRTSPTKRVRGETRKCRKVYGMDKKESWCTQCKWKKACTRFTD